MRVQRIVGIVGISALWTLWGGCGQETPPPKTAPVVKQILKPAPGKTVGKASTPKPIKTAPGRLAAGKASAKQPGSSKPAAGGPLAAKKHHEPRKVKYVYNPGDRPDPFRPFFTEATAPAVIPECEGVPPGPLTEREITQFTLVAVVGSGPESFAMVEDPEGKGYVLRLNTYLGKKCGKVAWIGPDGVIVEEPYRDLLGRKKTRRVALELKPSKGGENL